MMQYLKNLWNAQRNAANVIVLCELDRTQSSIISTQRSTIEMQKELTASLKNDVAFLTFDRNAYRCLTATLAAEYYQAIDSPMEQSDIPDSIKEAHMLKGASVNWVAKGNALTADDIRIGKPMWEKRQRAEAKRLEQQDHLKAVMSGAAEPELPGEWTPMTVEWNRPYSEPSPPAHLATQEDVDKIIQHFYGPAGEVSEGNSNVRVEPKP